MVATEFCFSVADSEIVVAGLGVGMEVVEASSDVKLEGNAGLLVCSVTWGVDAIADTNVDVDVDVDVDVNMPVGSPTGPSNETANISDSDVVPLCGYVISGLILSVANL